MKKILIVVWALLNLAMLSWNTAAASKTNDEGFVRQFSSYRSKNNVSTYKAAQGLAMQMRMKPEQVLKRYISASYSMGGTAKQAAVVYGVDAFKEAGMSHQAAITQVSDSVGQLTETLEAIYNQAHASLMVAKHTAAPAMQARRGLASVRSR